MNPILIFILTRTGIIRWLGTFVATSLISYGVVEESAKANVAGAVVAIVTGLITMLIEQRKASEVKKTQELLDDLTPASVIVRKDGLSGPGTRLAVKIASNPNRKG